MPETLQPIMMKTGEGLSVTTLPDGQRLTLVVGMKTEADCILHWGLSRRPGAPWRRPPDAFWPQGTTPAEGPAVRTPFAATNQGQKEVAIHFDLPCPESNLAFVVHFPRENRWLKSGGKDFSVPLPNGHHGPSPEEALAAWVPEEDAARQVFTLESGDRMATATRVTAEGRKVTLVTEAEAPLDLHWGVVWHFRHEWKLPPEDFRPAGTTVFQQEAARTPFTERDGLRFLEVNFPTLATGEKPRGMKFILLQPETGSWLKSGGKEIYLPLFESEGDSRLPSSKLRDLAEQIVGAEMGAGSWTLMHRFHLCHDLLEAAQDDEEALALLFTWLRYSSIRQLDWQRRFNTKPRELSHAQDRLTTRLAGVWRRHLGPDGAGRQVWARRLLTTLGRGGDGQRVRDEILQIMHRNHLKETSGQFIEEWHQKLHNNTTPDDVVLCEAYLAFLSSNGNRDLFYQTLEKGGVTRDRLRSFERPIKTDPDFYADRKNALIPEFENFLRILKSVHAGTDLESAAAAARPRLNEGQKQKLDHLLWLRSRNPGVKELAGTIVSVRESLREALLAIKDDAGLRDLLYLDLALEESFRGAIERQNLSQFGRDDLVELVQWALRNLDLSTGLPELSLCGGHWAQLLAQPRAGREWALHAKSVADRAGRCVQGITDELYRVLQPKAEFLGMAFGAAAWTVPLFSEEVIRGGPAFVLSLLLRHLDPLLRQAAGLGGWQVISPGRGAGRVRLTDRLLAVQGERYPEATVLIADAVEGSEEIPEGVTAVLTSATPDLVSHVAVRARNARVLFATCFEPQTYQQLKARKDGILSLRVTPGGDVALEEGTAQAQSKMARKPEHGRAFRSSVPSFSGWVVMQDQFTPQVVGGKSNNLNGLRGRLPDWIHGPVSLALPFGVFEKTLEDARNRDVRGKYTALLATAEADPAGVLPRVRELLLDLAPPAALQQSLRDAWQRVGLPAVPWEQTWRSIQRVWASKWNERAFLSRRARGVAHDDLRMAVLIQQVVEADYAFVIHTVNPLTGNREEIYAEVVLGLGETLVGNYPGRALGFTCRKADLKPEILSYPGKSLGLYGRGVIFRSDSNGEDLEGFAGAGLYDSVLAEEPEQRLLDYRKERLVWDPDFRDGLLRAIARIGLEVENILGSPQDIEGAVAGGVYFVVQTRPQVGLSSE